MQDFRNLHSTGFANPVLWRLGMVKKLHQKRIRFFLSMEIGHG